LWVGRSRAGPSGRTRHGPRHRGRGEANCSPVHYPTLRRREVKQSECARVPAGKPHSPLAPVLGGEGPGVRGRAAHLPESARTPMRCWFADRLAIAPVPSTTKGRPGCGTPTTGSTSRVRRLRLAGGFAGRRPPGAAAGAEPEPGRRCRAVTLGREARRPERLVVVPWLRLSTCGMFS